MITLKTPQDIERMRVAGRLAAEVLQVVAPHVKPGVSTAELDRMIGELARMVAAYAPWTLTAYRIENITVYPWVVGFKYNPFNQNPWQYLDIDLGVPRKAVQ